MKPKNLLLIGGGTVLAAAAAVFFWSSDPKSPADVPGTAKTEPTADLKRPRPSATAITGHAEGNGTPSATGESSGKLTPEQQAALEKEREDSLVILDQAATTYDAAQLPVIDKYLYHKDPAIRKAAMDAMIVLGDHGAGKLLRDAAQSAASEEEKKALLAAADYAELPPVSATEQANLLKKHSNSETRQQRRQNRIRGLSTARNGTPQANPASPSAPAPSPSPAPPPGQ